MSDQEDTNPPKKSIPDLRSIPSNVVPLPEPKKRKDKGPAARDIHYAVVQAMCGKGIWPVFPAKLYKVIDERGEALVYVEKDGVIINRAPMELDSLITSYWHDTLTSGHRPIILGNITADDAAKIRKLWLISAKPHKNNFPMVVWKSDPRPAHHRLAFDPLPITDLDAAAPLFAEIMSRASNYVGLMAFIGSLFDSNSQCQQYAWMHGDGRDGKGSILRLLSQALGGSYHGDDVNKTMGAHWTSALVGKRLVAFPDCNNSTFITSGTFKSLTGEDKVPVNIKHGAILSLRLPVKFIFGSNKRPDVSSQKADLRRIIYCSFQPIVKEEENYEARLEKELPAVISACWQTYLEVTKGDPRAVYPIGNVDEIADLTSDTEHEYETFVSGSLIVTPKEDPRFIDPNCLNNAQYRGSVSFAAGDHVQASHMLHEMENRGFKHQVDRSKLRDFLRRKYGIFTREIKKDGRKKLAYLNCAAAWQVGLRQDG